jgi:hypothetical protein
VHAGVGALEQLFGFVGFRRVFLGRVFIRFGGWLGFGLALVGVA